MADFVRLQITGSPRDVPCRIVELPSRIDRDYANAVVQIGVHARTLARSWQGIEALALQGAPITLEDRANLQTITDRLIQAIDHIAPDKKGMLGRLLASSRVLLNQRPSLP